MIRLLETLMLMFVFCANLCHPISAQEQAAPDLPGSRPESVGETDVAAFDEQLANIETNLLHKPSRDYIFGMGEALLQAQKSPISSSNAVRKLLQKYAKKVFQAKLPEPIDAKALDVQFKLGLALFADQPLSTGKELTEADREIIVTLLTLWNRSLAAAQSYSQFDPYNPSAEWQEKLDYERILSSYKGGFGFGMTPAAITDPKVRKEYEAYLKNRDEFLRGSVKFGNVTQVGEYFRIRAIRYLATEFRDRPNDETLAALIRKHVTHPLGADGLRNRLSVAIENQDGPQQ